MQVKRGLVKTIFLFTLLGIVLLILFGPPNAMEEAYLKEVSYAMSVASDGAIARQVRVAETLSAPAQWICSFGNTNLKFDDVNMPLANWDRVSDWWASRSQACYTAAKLMTFRLAGAVQWFPVLIPVLIAVLIDAGVVRKIRSYRFSFPSPGMNFAARKSLGGLIAFFLIMLAAPVPFHPLIYPIVVIAFGAISWVWMVNLQKKI